MVENNRKPIASLNMFPQFTTMNVIDGQAGIIIYSSLICYSLTIDNILNIIVLLILAGVTIATLTGDNGLLTKAAGAKEKNREGQIEEQIRLAYNEWQIEGRQGTAETLEEFIQKKLSAELQEETLEVEKEVEGVYIITINRKDYIFTVSSGNIDSETSVERIKKSTAKSDSYVNYYADIDKDGTVDGIIFVDLLTGSIRDTQQWENSDGTYELPKNVATSNVNSYYISQNSYTDSKFGTHPVISPKTTNKEERFYVMALKNFTTPAYIDENDSTKNYPAYTTYCWYKDSWNKICTYDTLGSFGKGRENTATMIGKWNANGGKGGYANTTQNNQDIWKHIQTKYSQGWFIPSRAEWAAFANELGITKENFSTILGVSPFYSSSQSYEDVIWVADFSEGKINISRAVMARYVRLVTTF